MKKSKSIFTVVLATILVVVLCTWIFPSASYQSTLVEGERLQVGLFDLFSYPMVAATYFGYVVVYTLAVGMFYGVANKIPAYHLLIEKIKKLYTGREALFLAIVMVLISAIVSVTGLSFGMIFVFPFIISVVLAMGYNKLVAASVTVGSVMAGLAGTTLGNSTVSYMNQLLGVDIMDEMISKVVILVVFVIILVANVLLYAKKTKSNTISAEVVDTKKKVEKSEEEAKPKKEVSKKDSTKKTSTKKTTSAKKATTSKKTTETKKTKSSKATKSKSTRASMAKNNDEVLKVKNKEKKPKCWPFVLIFDLMIIILALAVFDWSGVFEITWFSDAKEAINDFKVLGFPIFSKLLGTYSEFGSWGFNVEIPAFIMISTLILALVYRVKCEDLAKGIEDGVKKAVKPAIVMLLVYVVLIIATYHPFQLMITKFILDLTSGLNVVTMSIVAMFASLFNVDSIYVAQSTVPYVMSIIGKADLYPLVGIIFQAIYGLMMLVLPTSVILVGTLSYLNVSYGEWLKYIWKMFVELLIVLLVIFLIILAI